MISSYTYISVGQYLMMQAMKFIQQWISFIGNKSVPPLGHFLSEYPPPMNCLLLLRQICLGSWAADSAGPHWAAQGVIEFHFLEGERLWCITGGPPPLGQPSHLCCSSSSILSHPVTLLTPSPPDPNHKNSSKSQQPFCNPPSLCNIPEIIFCPVTVA